MHVVCTYLCTYLYDYGRTEGQDSDASFVPRMFGSAPVVWHVVAGGSYWGFGNAAVAIGRMRTS